MWSLKSISIMKMNNKNLILVLLFFMSIDFLQSQTTVEFAGRPITSSARTASLGGAAVGEAYDINSIYWNPATLSFLRQSSIMVSSIVGHSGESFENTLLLPPLYSDHYQTVAIGVSGSTYGKKWTQPYFTYSGVDVGYAVKLHQTFSLGLLLNFRYGSSSQSGLWATSASIGSFYSPSAGISYGFMYDGIGMGVLYKYFRNAGTLTYQHDLDQSMNIGSSFRFPSLFRLPYITLTLSSQKFISRSGITYRGGIETYPFDNVSLRIGILSSSIATAGSYGFGFVFSRLRIDYSFSPNHKIERFHQLSVSYPLGK